METSATPGLADLTRDQLFRLHQTLHRSIVRLYDTASGMYAEMTRMSDSLTPAYSDLSRKAALLRAAADEQRELSDEIRAIIWPEAESFRC